MTGVVLFEVARFVCRMCEGTYTKLYYRGGVGNVFVLISKSVGLARFTWANTVIIIIGPPRILYTIFFLSVRVLPVRRITDVVYKYDNPDAHGVRHMDTHIHTHQYILDEGD